MKITNNKEQDSKYYDKIYSTVPQKVVPRQREVAKHIEFSIEHPNILDVGCGCGTFAEVVNGVFWEYRGFDFSAEAIEQAKKHRGFNFWVGDVYNPQNYLPLDYNVIVCGQVLEHVDDLKLISRFPKNVHIICTVPTFNDPAHVRYYDSVGDVYNRFCDSMNIEKVVSICDNQIMMVGMK